MKLLKSRVLVVVIAIVIAFIFIVAGIGYFESQNETIAIVSVSANIRKGDIITKENLTTTAVGKLNMSTDYVTDPNEIIGKYALADFYPDDFILVDKVAENLPSAEEKLLKLDGKRIVISVTLKDFARGVSDKLVSGDIVSCIVTSNEDDTFTPMELKYIEVISTTMPSGVDKQQAGEQTEENLATITLKVTPYQAELLAKYDIIAETHFALVYRGDEDTAQKFIDKQAEALEAISAEQNAEEDTFGEAAA